MSLEIRLVNKNFIEPKIFLEKVLLITKKKGYKIEINNNKEYGAIYKVYNSNNDDYFTIDLPNKDEFNNFLKFHNNNHGILVQIDCSVHIKDEDLDNFIHPFIKDIINFFPSILINTGSEINYTYNEYIKFNEE